jgi:hypothetical protein
MAKTGVCEADPAMVSRVTDLKKELKRLVGLIVDDDKFSAENVDLANQTLFSLMNLKGNRSVSLKIRDSVAFPDEFKCPISKEIMKDPVIVSSGQTYDRPFIEKWLKEGNRVCPRTQQVLSNTMLIPNLLIRGMICKWCKNNGISLKESDDYCDADGLTKSDRDRFIVLLEQMQSTVSDQKEAAKEFRLLTKRMPSFRGLFGEHQEAIPRLLNPLIQTQNQNRGSRDLDLQEDLITTLLNLSINDVNKKIVAETPIVIPLILDALKFGKIETRSNAAAALFTLSALDTNKALIGENGALKPLIDLLDEGHTIAIKDVASAIFNLCIHHDNRGRAVRDGAVRVIVEKLKKKMHIDELLAILAMLSTNQRALDELGEIGGVQCLLEILRQSSCGRVKENGISILYNLCFNDRTKWKEMKEEENMFSTFSQLAKTGTARAKRKANGILERLNRKFNLTHTA